jgi:hypothetical protein
MTDLSLPRPEGEMIVTANTDTRHYDRRIRLLWTLTGIAFLLLALWFCEPPRACP